MSLKLVPPPSPRSSRVKVCAFQAFRLVRFVQDKAANAPSAIAQVRDDIVVAWQESARPNA
jgi:hypothetical protein